jgi:hypothetical protein
LTSQFAARVLASVTTSLEKYGAAVGQVLLWNFEKETKLSSTDIARKPQEFMNCVYRIFGPSAVSIEKGMTEELCREFKLDTSVVPGFVKAVEIGRANALREELTDRA